MAKNIYLKRPILKGAGPSSIRYGAGFHSGVDADWLMNDDLPKALIASGELVIKGDTPQEPTNLAEVTITDQGFIQEDKPQPKIDVFTPRQEMETSFDPANLQPAPILKEIISAPEPKPVVQSKKEVGPFAETIITRKQPVVQSKKEVSVKKGSPKTKEVASAPIRKKRG